MNAIDLSLFEPEVVRLLEAIRNSSLGGSKEASPNKPPTERTAAQQSFSSTPPAASSTTPTPSLRPTTAFHDTHPSILAIRSTHEARVLGALEVARVEAGVGLVTEGHADGHASGPASARGLPGAGEAPGPVADQVRANITSRLRKVPVRCRPLYSAEGLLELVVTAANASASPRSDAPAGPLPHRMRIHEAPLRLPYYSVRDLAALLLELEPKHPQHGVDDLFSREFDAARIQEGEKMLASGPLESIRARTYLRRGCPPALRGPMWAAALGLPHICTRQVDVWRRRMSATSTGKGSPTTSSATSRPSSARRSRASDEPDRPMRSAASSTLLGGGGGGGGSPSGLGSKEGSPRRSSFSMGGAGGDPSTPGSGPRSLPELLEDRARCASWYIGLQREVLRRSMLTDLLAHAEMRHMCNSERYFIFEDPILTVLLALTRDPSLSAGAALLPHPLAAGYGRRAECHGLYPPSGLLPFRGLGCFVAPLCYVLEEPAEIFAVAKRLHQDLFCRLHVLSAIDEPETVGSLLSLAGVLTRIVHEADPDLTAHLEGITGASPLELAYPWLAGAFAEHLEVDQLMYLWDRVIGFRSLLPLSILAAGVMLIKKDLLMLAQTAAEAKEAVRDLSKVNVGALLQGTLFGALGNPQRVGAASAGKSPSPGGVGSGSKERAAAQSVVKAVLTRRAGASGGTVDLFS